MKDRKTLEGTVLIRVKLRGIRALMALTNPKTWGPFLIAYQQTAFDAYFKVSYSQSGEDLALIELLGERQGRYLDIGAHHPNRVSNTRLLYNRGWSGVNVEANPQLLNAFQKWRPRDINVHACVGTKPEYLFTIFRSSELSSFNEEWISKFQSLGRTIERQITLEGTTLRTLLDKYFPEGGLDLLLIDAEGSDFEVLQSADFLSLPKHRFPRFILVESPCPVEFALREPSVELLEEIGYIPVVVLTNSIILTLGPSLIPENNQSTWSPNLHS